MARDKAKARKPRVRQDEVVRRFGQRLREVRQARGMSRAELAERAEVSRPYLGYLERGTTTPGIDLLVRLAAALGVPPGDLLPVSPAASPAPAVVRERLRANLDAVMETADDSVLAMLNVLLAALRSAPSAR
jgi:transcriptional regulator with XRE-family HTH domain